jgi:hypothetical protein
MVSVRMMLGCLGDVAKLWLFAGLKPEETKLGFHGEAGPGPNPFS